MQGGRLVSLAGIVPALSNVTAKFFRRLSKLPGRTAKRLADIEQLARVSVFVRVTLIERPRTRARKLSRRVTRRVASVWQMIRRSPAGIVASYYAHDWLLSNRRSRSLYRASPPALDDVQRGIVEQLTARGMAVVPFETLFTDDGLWQQMSADADRFRAGAEVSLAHVGAPWGTKAKRHLWRRYSWDTELALEDRWLGLGASCRMLDIVNSYLELCAKLIYVDQWYTPTISREAERTSSQNWHRDFTDRHLVKVFIYLTDVDEGGGPFEYVPESAVRGRYSRLWPWRPLGQMYPPAEEFQRQVPSSAVATITGRAGTVIFCDTSGFHRGGFATEHSRMMAVFNYASPACLRSLATRNFHVFGSNLPGDLPKVVRFALS